MGNSLSTVLYVALGIFLAFGVNQGLAFALSTDLPIVAVESNSMIPTFHKGDILTLQGVNSEDLQVGDIIVFDPPNRDIAVVHRIVEINDDGTFQTKGDANSGQLPYEKRISASSIHGKVVLIIPYLGWVKIGITEYIVPNIARVAIVVVLLIALYLGATTVSRRVRSRTHRKVLKSKKQKKKISKRVFKSYRK